VNAAAGVDQDVARLEIAVHRVRGVNGVDATARAVEDLDRVVDPWDAQRAARTQPFFERHAPHELHHQIRRAVDLSKRVHVHHVRMVHARHRARLGEKAQAYVGRARLFVAEHVASNDLDRNVSIATAIVREHDDTHRAGAERTDDFVRVADERAGWWAKRR
jgi:hypothetical protein